MTRPQNLFEAQSRLLTPLTAFGLCLALTIGASFFAFESAKNENAGRFDRAIGSFQDTLRNRMVVYTNAIIYTRNLFNVRPDLTQGEYQQFVQEMELKENFPGIQTLGYVLRLPVSEARTISEKLGVPRAKLPGARKETGSEADIVRYVELLHAGSESALGLDLSESPERKEAMDEARDTGAAVASKHVLPMSVAAGYPMEQAFLVFVPLYKSGMPTSTVVERRAAIKGFIYSAFHAANLFGKITEDARFRKAEFIVRIYDGTTLDKSQLMYAEGPEHIDDPLMSRNFVFHFADHEWLLSIIAPQSYSVPALRWLPSLVFSLGFLLSIFLALALRQSQSLARRLADDIVVREETQRLLSEARTDAEEANRAKSIFLANISHEIRTPLGVILGFSEIALGQTDASEREVSLKTVIRNGRELTRIIGDVLDVSKIEAQTLKIEELPFDLGRTVRDVIQIWEPQIRAKGVSFLTDLASDLPTAILSDETRIKQVLTNLLSNAMKFTSKGSVSFAVSATRLSEDRAQLTFKVTDSGIGISLEQQDRLFKPFSQGDSSITRKYGGSGLGLALSRAIATTLGGALSLESGAGGTTFSFSFPVKTVGANALAVASSAVPSLTGRKILLVDDSPDNRALVSMMLKKAEATVDVAVDGDDGVQKALNRTYDLILMDIQMPNKDGYTALRELRDVHHLTVPVIALTAHALSEERDRALASGFAGYITKPVDRETLVRVSAETFA